MIKQKERKLCSNTNIGNRCLLIIHGKGGHHDQETIQQHEDSIDSVSVLVEEEDESDRGA